MATTLRGWATAEQGRPAEGIAVIRAGLVAFRATGMELEQAHYLCLLAEAYMQKVAWAKDWRL